MWYLSAQAEGGPSAWPKIPGFGMMRPLLRSYPCKRLIIKKDRTAKIGLRP